MLPIVNRPKRQSLDRPQAHPAFEGGPSVRLLRLCVASCTKFRVLAASAGFRFRRRKAWGFKSLLVH